jgi:hypothetical protein
MLSLVVLFLLSFQCKVSSHDDGHLSLVEQRVTGPIER